MEYRPRTRDKVVTLLLAGSLVLAPGTALAEDTDLESLQNAAIAAGDAYQQAEDRVDEIQQQISSNQQKVDELQAELPAKRESASKAIRLQYKLSQDQPNLIGMLLSSTDLNEFLAQLHYLDSITSSNTNAINDLAQAQSELDTTQAQLQANLQEADSQRTAAAQALQDAQAKADAAKQKALEEAAANQAAYEAQQAAGESDPTEAEVEQADTTSADTDSAAAADNDSADSSTQAAPAPAQDTSTERDQGGSAATPASSSSSQAAPAASYTYVQASTYGEGDGFMYGTTASGDTVTPTSMAVAMKTMPLGTVIEISYNGKTVRAVVNDRGPYAGNRQIDLQPAVAHALGFDGVGTVGYRVVG